MSKSLSLLCEEETTRLATNNLIIKREYLLNWLLEISQPNNISHKTIELTIKYIDLYLDNVVIADEYLQLLGITALALAIKFNESYENIVLTPSLCVSACLKYTVELVYTMELELLSQLKWKLYIETPSDILSEIANQMGITYNKQQILDIILFMMMDHEFTNYSSKDIVLVSLYFASNETNRQIIKKYLGSSGLQIYQTKFNLLAKQLGSNQKVENDEMTPKKCDPSKKDTIRKRIRKPIKPKSIEMLGLAQSL